MKKCKKLWENKLIYTYFTSVWNIWYRTSRSSHWRYSIKKVLLKTLKNLQENTCARGSFLIKCRPKGYSFIKKETLGQDFSCEFGEISKNNFSTEHLLATASGLGKMGMFIQMHSLRILKRIFQIINILLSLL